MMAGVAGSSGMRTDQRKPVIVLLRSRHRRLPAPDRVTVLAAGSELPAVQIRMALRALRGRFGKNQVRMATLACHPLVQTKQRETGPGVVEFLLSADRLPGRGRVTVLARHAQVAMRIRNTAAHRVLCRQRRYPRE